MSRNKFLLALVLIGLIGLASAQVDTAWVRRYNGSVNGTDVAKAIAVRADTVYVTGYSSNASNTDYLTIKYLPNGDTVWTRRYDGTGNGNDQAVAIAVDTFSGNVYVTGHSKTSATSSNDFTTIKYTATGAQQWVKTYDGVNPFTQEHGDDKATAIAVRRDTVYVTGSADIYGDYGYPGIGGYYDYVTIKYDPSGNELWVAIYDCNADNDLANAIAVDGSGNVYVTGQSSGTTNVDYATVKYNASGTEQWVKRYNGTGNSTDYAKAIAVRADTVYVTGYSNGPSATNGWDYLTIKYKPNGDTAWVRRYNGHSGSTNNDDYAYAIAVDGDGNVGVTGQSNNGSGGLTDDYVTIKYQANGDTAWLRRYDAPPHFADYGIAIAVDGAGNVYVTGYARQYYSGSLYSYDYTTIKYNASGVQEWVAIYNNDAVNGEDEANAIAVDGAGNVYVTGYIQALAMTMRQ